MALHTAALDRLDQCSVIVEHRQPVGEVSNRAALCVVQGLLQRKPDPNAAYSSAGFLQTLAKLLPVLEAGLCQATGLASMALPPAVAPPPPADTGTTAVEAAAPTTAGAENARGGLAGTAVGSEGEPAPEEEESDDDDL